MTSCYTRNNGNRVLWSSAGKCASANPQQPYVSCCGVGDLCLENGMCQFTHQINAGSATGYYTSACTDPSLVACNTKCGQAPGLDVMYNFVQAAWSCCTWSNGLVNCNIGNQSSQFALAAPGLLKTTASVVDTTRFALINGPSTAAAVQYTSYSVLTSSSSSNSALATTTVTAVSTSYATITSVSTSLAPNVSTISHVPSAVWAGFGVLVGVTAFALIGVAYLALMLRRLSKKQRATPGGYVKPGTPKDRKDLLLPVDGPPKAGDLEYHELTVPYSELDATPAARELQGNGATRRGG